MLSPRPAHGTAIEAAIARVEPALVRIHVVDAYFRGGRSLKTEASGSGAIISPDGYIVTNHHVAGDAVRITCTMPGGEDIDARLVGTDAMADIAVIKLEPKTPRTFAQAEWGDSDALRVGDTVLAMGSPLALSQSVTEGIVSNARMTLPGNSQMELDGENVGAIVRWIGHDAAIFPGNSGGPLVNLRGEVIGINEISMGLGGAIPGNLARQVAAELIAKGHIDRAWLGFVLQPLPRGDADRQGAIVSDVVEESPAARAGIRAGDRLMRVDGRPINVQYAEELPPQNLFLASLPIGRPVEAELRREGAMIARTLTPALRERVLSQEREYESLGITGRDLSLWTRLEMRRPNRDGVLVTSVRPGGPAGQARPSIDPGDILLRLGEEPIADMDALSSITERLTAGRSEPTPMLATFERRGAQMISVVEIGRRELNNPGAEVRKAWLPIETQVLTSELREALGLGSRGGVRVTRLYEDRPTTQSDALRVGDLILALDGNPIPAREPHDVEVFETMIRQYPIGTSVTLAVQRDGRERQVAEQLLISPPPPREMKRYEDSDFDVTVRNVSYMDRKLRRWEDAKGGVLVDSVAEGGWAALGRLGVGDLLLEVDGKPMNDVEDVRAALETVKTQKKASIICKVRRGIHTLFVEIEPLWNKGL